MAAIVGGVLGALGGGVVGLLGGPAGVLAGATAGAGAGAAAGAAIGAVAAKGRRNSKPAPPPPSPCFSKPWRNITWGNNRSALESVMCYEPQTEGRQIRILLHGPVGAGKSSFINSVISVIKGRRTTLALADAHGAKSFTKEYKTYKIQKGGPGSFYPFVFNDIMGLDRHGVLVDDVKLALKGRVKDGYKFNPACRLSENNPFYNHSPTDNDKVQVLVCVVPANASVVANDETVKKIREIRMEASDLGIPQVAILTKIDEACPEVGEDLQNVYKSKKLKQTMEEFSTAVGIPMNCIFPVKNYDSEIDLHTHTLILEALRNIINFGEDYINFQYE